MQSKNTPLKQQESMGSHVSFSPIEERHFSIDQQELTKINKNLELELQSWNELFVELTQILTKATTYPPIFIQKGEDKRNILKMLCTEVTNKALDPTLSDEYKLLKENLTECQNKVEELKIRCEEISENTPQIPKEITIKEKNVLDQKIGNLETVLKRQLKNRKDQLNKEKNKSLRKRKSELSSFGINDSRRVHQFASFSNLSNHQLSDFPFTHRFSIPEIDRFNFETENSLLNE